MTLSAYATKDSRFETKGQTEKSELEARSYKRLSRFHVEDRGIGILKKCRMQRAHRLVGILLIDHEAHVDFAGALRDHAHVDMSNRAEHLRSHTALAANIFAYHAYQRLPAFILHIGKLA